jgi:bifunctional non-homologous end joining protein LigD
MLPRIHPMRLRLVDKPFDHPDYIFELKHDGFRAIAYIQKGECKLISRNLHNLRFSSLKKELAKLPVADAIIDGEIVCLDAQGVSQFYQLLSRKAKPALYAFDLLWLNGEDLRNQPLTTRKEMPRTFNPLSRRPSDSLCAAYRAYGKRFFEEICGRDLEGIVAKRKLSFHKDGGKGWLKIKNRTYSQAEGRHELLTRKKK